MALQVWVW